MTLTNSYGGVLGTLHHRNAGITLARFAHTQRSRVTCRWFYKIPIMQPVDPLDECRVI